MFITNGVNCAGSQGAVNTSAPVIHKVGNIEQLPVEINWKYLPDESFLMQIHICHGTMN